MKCLVASSFCLLAALVIWSCKKHSSTTTTTPTNTAYCTVCNENAISHKADADSAFYFLPTAFTPNGDGRNDLYGMTYGHLIVDSSTLTIWDMNGKELYSKTVANRWDGTDLSGNRVGAGNYPVHVKLKTANGATLDVCTCVTILQYTGSCIKTNGITYYFPDQIDPTNGFEWPTMETLCP